MEIKCYSRDSMVVSILDEYSNITSHSVWGEMKVKVQRLDNGPACTK